MVNIKGVDCRAVNDSRGEKTIEVEIKTNVGTFTASSPTGKSTGKHEAKPYKKNLEGDIKTLKEFSEYFSEEILEKLEDLRRIEDIVDGHVGSNTTIALESAVLKAMAKEQGKEIWEIIDPTAKKIPRLVGNTIGGGKHSEEVFGRKPDFQEFLLIPNEGNAKKNFNKNKGAKLEARNFLKRADPKFKGGKNDEDAWMTSLNEKQVLEVLEKVKIPMGLDIAASSFYSRKKYNYNNPPIKRTAEEQVGYLSNLIRNFNLFYIEDPFSEDDFESFAALLQKFPDSLIVGDDLTTTSSKRLLKAIAKKSINAIIIKPNQCGSLLEVKRVVEICKENDIKMVFSHRSGETQENILADLAIGFGADFLKCGITGKERESKINRLIEIEKKLK